MGKPFDVQMRRYEVVGGLIWLVCYIFLMSGAIYLGLHLLGLSVDAVTLNKVYFVANFIITAVLFRRFLAYSLPRVADQPGRVLKALLLGFCIYEGCQMAMSLIYGLLVPNLQTPNDDNVRSVAASGYNVMVVGAVLLAPLTEETLTRGLIFGTLRKKSRVLAYVVTALVFAGMHVVNYALEMDALSIALNMLLYALPSVALCACYEYAGTIWAPIALHMIINALSMYAMGQA